MELDRTLLVFDYLNGEPVELLDGHVADPIGPCAAAAAITRDAFLESGGFDERLFAYWEDVDLVLRLRRAGARCRLAPGARGVHQHSATLGSGSARKDYLVGFGRAYVLRKWGVLAPRRLPAVLARELTLTAGQTLIDRNLGAARGRLSGLRAAPASGAYPGPEVIGDPPSLASTLRRRWRRRARLRRRAALKPSLGAPSRRRDAGVPRKPAARAAAAGVQERDGAAAPQRVPIEELAVERLVAAPEPPERGDPAASRGR